MKPSNDLYSLIKSLTKTEKSYFRKLSSIFTKGKENSYIKLFNLIAKQVEDGMPYNEEKIKNKLSNDKLLENFAVMKNYLYNEILNSLAQYYTKNNKNLEIKDFLKMAEILFHKGMYDQCQKILKKAKAEAYKYEKLLVVLEITNWELKLNINMLNYGILESQIEELKDEEKMIMDKIKNLQDYQHLQTKITLLRQKKGFIAMDEKSLKEYRSIMDNRLLKNVSEAKSFAAKNLFYQINLVYLNTTSDYTEGYELCKNFVELFENDRAKIMEMKKNYLSALNNYLIRCLYLKKYDEFQMNFKKYREITLETSDIQGYILSYNLNLYFYKLTGQFEKAVQVIPLLIEDMKRYKGRYHKSVELYLYYNVAYIFFIAADYNNCIKYLNLLLNDDFIKTRDDLFFFAKFLFILVHYELKNFDLVESLLKSAYGFLSKKKQTFESENIIIRYIKRLIIIDDKEKHKEELIILKNKLKKIDEVKEQKERTMDYFDYISWLEGKINNKKFSEILSSKKDVVEISAS